MATTAKTTAKASAFPPPLLYTRSPAAQVVVAVGVPVAFGVLTGLALGWSAGLYLVLLVLGILGGLAAGFEHESPLEGLYRGLLGGLLFTTGILVAHGIADVRATTQLPDPEELLLVVNSLIAAGLGAFGARLRSRRG